MILEDSSPGFALQEKEYENPFLTTTVILTEFGTGVTGWAMRKRMPKIARNLRVATKRVSSIEKSLQLPKWSGRTQVGGYRLDVGKTAHDLIAWKKGQPNRAIGLEKWALKAKSANKKARMFSKISKGFSRTSRFLAAGSLLAMGYEMTSGLFDITNSFAESRSSLNSAIMPSYQDTSYYDSRRAMTQRQRAIQAIHSSQLSTRAAFGQEASYLHM